jgi:hypothetical protein
MSEALDIYLILLVFPTGFEPVLQPERLNTHLTSAAQKARDSHLTSAFLDLS